MFVLLIFWTEHFKLLWISKILINSWIVHCTCKATSLLTRSINVSSSLRCVFTKTLLQLLINVTTPIFTPNKNYIYLGLLFGGFFLNVCYRFSLGNSKWNSAHAPARPNLQGHQDMQARAVFCFIYVHLCLWIQLQKDGHIIIAHVAGRHQLAIYLI